MKRYLLLVMLDKFFLLKTHLKQSVCLVKDNVFYIGKFQFHFNTNMQESSGRCNYDIWIAVYC